MRVCQAVGIPHPDFLYQILTPRQLEDWHLFYSIEPWGTPVADYHAAMGVWGAIVATQGKKAKNIETYLPKWGGSQPLSANEYKLRARRAHAKAAAGFKA